MGVKLECLRLDGGGSGGQQSERATSGWLGGCCGVTIYLLEVKGAPSLVVVRSSELEMVYPTIMFFFWKRSKALLAPATSL